MKLDEIGLYAVGYAYRGQAEQQFPLGWSGYFEAKTGVACLPFGEQNGRHAFLLHCPWRNGTGITFQQFNFSLPLAATNILLRGATAMKSDIVTNSDGVTFRIFANGVKMLEWHQTNDVWRTFGFDFTSLRGSNLLVRFEVDPGPADNPSFDYSFWGDRELVLAGYTPPPLSNPAPISLGLTNLLSAQTGDVAPTGGFAGVSSVQLSNDVVHLLYTGPDGVMEYQWQRPVSGTSPLFGTLTLNAQMTGQPPVSVPLANDAALAWIATATHVGSNWQPTNGGYALLHEFNVGGTNVFVRTVAQPVGKSLVLSVSCDKPFVTSLQAGTWGPTLRRRQVVTPYYSDAVYFLPRENLFVSAFLDWTASAASSQSGTAAAYGALTDGTRNLLKDRVIFSAGWHLAEVFPNLPNPPSPWRDVLADKILLDVWSGTFTNIANNLSSLADYGITHCVALVHNWQRSGYDNALPDQYPANASLGGEPGMSNLIAAARSVGIRTALHENYVDYYPNYDSFNTNDIALDSSGNFLLAWFNPGTGIQSFAEKPNAILRLAATQSPEIHARYGTDADYLDVHSAVPPWFHVDFRAGETGAGNFQRVWDVHRQLWDYERTTHGGPVFGEGASHWRWSGYLDGVEAQFGEGWPGGSGLTAPLSVDFDLLKIHPLQFNHGMGYYERWWPADFANSWAGLPPMIVLDQYRMQEVAYAHAGFLGGSTYSQVPLAWLEHHLLSPLMARYATARPVEILYESDGAWLDATAIAKLPDGGTNNRVRVTYDNGLVVTANSASNTLQTGSWTLPQFGWVAEGAGITAGTTLRDSVVADFADTGDTLFVNARSATNWLFPDSSVAYPHVTQFQQTGARAFSAIYQWDVLGSPPVNYFCFVHFTAGGPILWQQDHPVTPPTAQWQKGQSIADGPWTIHIPTNVPDGDYNWLIGLYDTASGARAKLSGADDGTSRIRLGQLHLATNGTSITFTAEDDSDLLALRRQHLNESNQVVNFGDVRTDGSAWLHREGGVWILKTWPRNQNFTLDFSAQRFAQPAGVQCIAGPTNSVAPISLGSQWRLPLNGAGEYRWMDNSFGLRIDSVTVTNNSVEFRWQAVTGVRYELEATSELKAASVWNVVFTPLTNGFATDINPIVTQRFYRVRAMLP